jgi:PAS domain-containing protein
MVDPFSEPVLAALLGAMPDGAAFCRLDYQGSVLTDCTVLYANPALHQLIGEGDLTGRHFGALFPESAAAQQDQPSLLARIVGQDAGNAYEHYRQAQEKWVSVSAYRPKAGHAMLVFRDVSSQHQVEGALLRSEARLRAIIETALHPRRDFHARGLVAQSLSGPAVPRLGDGRLGIAHRQVAERGNAL